MALTVLAAAPVSAQSRAALQETLEKTVIPKIEFRNVTVRDALDFLREASVTYGPQKDPERRGVTLIVQIPANQGNSRSFSFRAKNMTLQQALKSTCSAANLQYSLRSGWILIEPKKR
jgi:hypothetical protein